MEHCGVVVIHRRIIIFVQKSRIDKLTDGLVSQVRIDRAGSVSEQRREVMHFSRLPALQDHGHGSSLLCADQMLLQSGHRQKGWDRNMIFIYIPVCQDQDISALADYAVYFDEKVLNSLFKACILIVCDRDLCNLESIYIHVLDLQKVRIRQDRVIHAEHLAVLFLLFQKVSVPPHIDRRRGDDLLTDRVDRRICDLRKKLFEITEQRLSFFREHSKRDIDSHRRNSLSPVLCHSEDRCFHILIGVSERFLEAGALFSRVFRDILVRDLQILQLDQVPVKPFSVRFLVRIFFFQFLVPDHSSGNCIYEEHLAGMNSLFHQDLSRIDIQDSDLGGEDQVIIIRDVISGRSQTVPVQDGAHDISV